MFTLGHRVIYQNNINLALKEAKKNNFGIIEIHISAPQFLPRSFSSAKLQSAKNLAERYNITIQIHAPLELSLIFVNEDLRRAVKKQIKELFTFCEAINARNVTLHIGKADTYHDVNGKKFKNDDIYPKLYSKLFEDSLKYIVSIAPKGLNVCIENTDNFNSNYQKVLQKYLHTGKLFLTWDIRKSFGYENKKLIKEQWKFIKKNANYVKNLHISGLTSSHGEIKKWDNEFNKFFNLFKNKNLPIIIEIIPLDSAIRAKNIIKKQIKL